MPLDKWTNHPARRTGESAEDFDERLNGAEVERLFVDAEAGQSALIRLARAATGNASVRLDVHDGERNGERTIVLEVLVDGEAHWAIEAFRNEVNPYLRSAQQRCLNSLLVSIGHEEELCLVCANPAPREHRPGKVGMWWCDACGAIAKDICSEGCAHARDPHHGERDA